MRCTDPAECLYFLTKSVWADCDTCAGTGWAEDTSASPFCGVCTGSGLIEYDEAPGPVSPVACSRHAFQVNRVRALLASTCPNVAVSA
ncbi:hypothetical protein GTW43_22110 [Streptomyces sp. SID5785]|uniref:hypothetical protein n=1 Tax=Streptomyces sp. SID5785 TaxID=2690309 RepID=UPI001360F828|nr:hypothetical protein [Streptomyces sp. SID5785]MZD07754.1 hypothetical protein [Streptomyces sp. SID5785]